MLHCWFQIVITAHAAIADSIVIIYAQFPGCNAYEIGKGREYSRSSQTCGVVAMNAHRKPHVLGRCAYGKADGVERSRIRIELPRPDERLVISPILAGEMPSTSFRQSTMPSPKLTLRSASVPAESPTREYRGLGKFTARRANHAE